MSTDAQPAPLCFWLRRRSSTSLLIMSVCQSVRLWTNEKNVPECSRMHVECPKMFQNACRMFQNTCIMFQNVLECMQIFQNFPECMEKVPASTSLLYAGLWACMQLHKLTCSYISLHAVTRALMQVRKLSCSSLSLHEVPWACMQFHELVRSSFFCLSSSQEFCSACL